MENPVQIVKEQETDTAWGNYAPDGNRQHKY